MWGRRFPSGKSFLGGFDSPTYIGKVVSSEGELSSEMDWGTWCLSVRLGVGGAKKSILRFPNQSLPQTKQDKPKPKQTPPTQ